MKLVPKAWKFPSVWAAIIGILTTGIVELIREAWISLPPHIIDRIPYANRIGLFLLFMVLVVRVIKFSKEKPDEQDKQ